MPKLELKGINRLLKKQKEIELYVVETDKGIGTVRYAEEHYYGKVPVRLFDGTKLLVKEDKINVISIQHKKD